MKKNILLFLMMSVLFVCSACGNGSDKKTDKSDDSDITWENIKQENEIMDIVNEYGNVYVEMKRTDGSDNLIDDNQWYYYTEDGRLFMDNKIEESDGSIINCNAVDGAYYMSGEELNVTFYLDEDFAAALDAFAFYENGDMGFGNPKEKDGQIIFEAEDDNGKCTYYFNETTHLVEKMVTEIYDANGKINLRLDMNCEYGKEMEPDKTAYDNIVTDAGEDALQVKLVYNSEEKTYTISKRCGVYAMEAIGFRDHLLYLDADHTQNIERLISVTGDSVTLYAE